MSIKRAKILFFFSLISQLGWAQHKSIKFFGIPESYNIPYQSEKPNDYADAKILSDQLIDKLWSDGYQLATLDTLIEQENHFQADVFLGPKLETVEINIDSLDHEWLSQIQFDPSILSKTFFDPSAKTSALKNLLSELEKIGYPLAQISYEDIDVNGTSYQARLNIDRGVKVNLDTLEIKGNLNLSRNYLENYLGFEAGKIYNQSEVNKYQEKLRELSFLSIAGEPKVSFVGDKARLLLPLNSKPSSRFDFLIGLLPNTQNGNQSFTLAVDLTVDLLNQLGLGEHFFLQFRRLRPETQELSLEIDYPYLFNLPIGVETSLDIFRNSDEYIEVDFDVGWQYFFSGNNYVKAFWNLYSSRLLELDTAAILSRQRLPNQLDVSYNAFGLALDFEQLDYRFNPRSGFHLKSSASIGTKSILPNLEILDLRNEQVDFSTSYDSLSNNPIQYRVKLDLDYFLPLGPRSTLLFSTNNALLLGSGTQFQNEFFRIGGNKLLRGFDEESIFSNQYHVITTEYRLLLGRNSYLSAFGDYAVIKNDFLDDPWQNAYGIGTGLNFETTAGIFGISIANGTTGDISFGFRNAKIHFGFESIF